MSDHIIKQASLEDIRRMKDSGSISAGRNAPAGETLGADFWATATIETPKKPRSVHLKLDPEVFEFFRTQSGGKGHLTKMQNVLRAYANAHRR